MTDSDPVDAILEQWRRERPDLDPSPMGVIGRISRLSDELEARLRPTFAAHGLGEGEFDVLATLRRGGPRTELTPGELTASMMVTSGAVSKRLDRLVGAGLVRRRSSDHDARSRLVSLTDQGRELVDAAVEAHLANEERLLSGLSPEERRQLADLLRRLTLSLPAG